MAPVGNYEKKKDTKMDVKLHEINNQKKDPLNFWDIKLRCVYVSMDTMRFGNKMIPHAYLCIAKSNASAATVFSPPDKLSIGRNLRVCIKINITRTLKS